MILTYTACQVGFAKLHRCVLFEMLLIKPTICRAADTVSRLCYSYTGTLLKGHTLGLCSCPVSTADTFGCFLLITAEFYQAEDFRQGSVVCLRLSSPSPTICLATYSLATELPDEASGRLFKLLRRPVWSDIDGINPCPPPLHHHPRSRPRLLPLPPRPPRHHRLLPPSPPPACPRPLPPAAALRSSISG